MADLMNNGEQTFLDQNGNPLSGGMVAFFVPNTSVQADTFTDETGTVKNSNPVVLDQAGRATIWGEGSYRQVVSDQFGNVQWDRITTAGLAANAVLPGNLTVSGTLNVNGSSNFTGPATFSSPIFANQGIQASNIHATNFLNNDGALQQNGPAFFAGTMTVNGILTAQDSIAVHNDVKVGRRLIVESGSAPSIAFINDVDGSSFGMWNASGTLQLGTADASGDPNVSLVSLDATGLLNVEHNMEVGGSVTVSQNVVVSGTISSTLGMTATGGLTSGNGITVAGGASQFNGDIVPQTDNANDLGSASIGWRNVYAHNYVTLSTLASSPEVESGTILGIIGQVAVKTLPHLGISADDVKTLLPSVIDETGKGINYNAVVGMLWQAIKELNAEFNAYKAAHP